MNVIFENSVMGLMHTVCLTLMHVMDRVVIRATPSVIKDDVGRLPDSAEN